MRLGSPTLILTALLLLTAVPATGTTDPAIEDPAPSATGPTSCQPAAATIAFQVRTLPATPASHQPSTDPCPGIRPGGALVLRAGPFELMYCTMAFIVTDGADTYVATAGHCVDPSLGVPGPGEEVSAHGVPGTFGTVAYQWCEGGDALGNGCGAGTDFALIRVHEDKLAYVDPAMCHWGAPTGGLFTAFDTSPRTVQHFGWGMFLGEPSGVIVTTGNPATQARQGLGLDFSNETFALIESAAISGDSGSGVLVTDLLQLPVPAEDPQALGVLTHISVGGLAFVQRLDVSLDRAGDELGTELSLVTGASG